MRGHLQTTVYHFSKMGELQRIHRAQLHWHCGWSWLSPIALVDNYGHMWKFQCLTSTWSDPTCECFDPFLGILLVDASANEFQWGHHEQLCLQLLPEVQRVWQFELQEMLHWLTIWFPSKELSNAKLFGGGFLLTFHSTFWCENQLHLAEPHVSATRRKVAIANHHLLIPKSTVDNKHLGASLQRLHDMSHDVNEVHPNFRANFSPQLERPKSPRP